MIFIPIPPGRKLTQYGSVSQLASHVEHSGLISFWVLVHAFMAKSSAAGMRVR